jgi:hypothetical protein
LTQGTDGICAGSPAAERIERSPDLCAGSIQCSGDGGNISVNGVSISACCNWPRINSHTRSTGWIQMRRFIGPLILALALSLASLGTAFGHVHGITPLSCLSTDNANSGALAAHGSPITGLIPNAVGNASLEPGTIGRLAAPCQ